MAEIRTITADDYDPGIKAVKRAWGEHISETYVPVNRLGQTALGEIEIDYVVSAEDELDWPSNTPHTELH